MQIKRTQTDKIINGSYLYWIQEVLPKHLEDNYEILTAPDIVDVFMINPGNGKKEFIDTTDRYIARQKYIETNDAYFMVDTTAKFDDKYRMIKRPHGSSILHFPDVLQFEDFDATFELTNSNMKSYSKIFISHSSKDKEIVEDLIEILEVIGVKHEDIFCSSIQGYGVSLGEDFLVRLKKELNEKVLVLFVLSQNFYDSPISLCEMGATWIKTNKHIPILIPPFDYTQIKGVINNIHGLRITDPLEINELKKELEIAFDLKPLDFSKWESKRDRKLANIKTKI